MDQWDMVTGLLADLAEQPNQALAAQGVLDLAEHIRVLPALADVQVGLAGMALALGVPGTRRRVHVGWVRPYVYAVFLDFCEGTFYGERVEVEIEDVVETLLAYLDRLRAEADE